MSVVNTRWMVKKIQAIQIVLFLSFSIVLLDSPYLFCTALPLLPGLLESRLARTGGGRVVMNRNCLSWTCTPTVYTVHRHCLVHCPSDLGTSTRQSTFCTKCTFLRDPLNWFILATFCVQSPSTRIFYFSTHTRFVQITGAVNEFLVHCTIIFHVCINQFADKEERQTFSSLPNSLLNANTSYQTRHRTCHFYT